MLPRSLRNALLLLIGGVVSSLAQPADLNQLNKKMAELEQMMKDLQLQIAAVEQTQKAPAGPAIATYDQNGKFVDPAGGTGVFPAGADKLAPAENWVDLMLAPRQA